MRALLRDKIARMFRRKLNKMFRLTRKNGQPFDDELWRTFKDTEFLKMQVKNFGYELARQWQPTLNSVDFSGEPSVHGLVSKPTTQADMESPWFAYWCSQLQMAPMYHRKLWEFAFVLQALYEGDLLREGIAGIGFGCGQEPLASYFASRNMTACVTDLDPQLVAGMGWAETGQHASTRDLAFHEHLVTREIFDAHVSHRCIDMNAVPPMDTPYDFCWSVCAMEHLGSIAQGLAFVENSLSVLKPGGLAIHTTEFNYLPGAETVDNWQTVLFQQKHFEQLAARLSRQGHRVLGPDFAVGSGVLDRYVDIPPFHLGEGWFTREQWDVPERGVHLKLALDGFPCTCFGILVRKG